MFSSSPSQPSKPRARRARYTGLWQFGPGRFLRTCVICRVSYVGGRYRYHEWCDGCRPDWIKRRVLVIRGAHQLVKSAIRKGILPPVSACVCADCGRSAECYDHRDYSHPLDVDPVCWSCNTRRGPAIQQDFMSSQYLARVASMKRAISGAR